MDSLAHTSELQEPARRRGHGCARVKWEALDLRDVGETLLTSPLAAPVRAQHVALEPSAAPRAIRIDIATRSYQVRTGLWKHRMGIRPSQLGADLLQPERFVLVEPDVLEERSIAAERTLVTEILGHPRQPFTNAPPGNKDSTPSAGPARRFLNSGVMTSIVT